MELEYPAILLKIFLYHFIQPKKWFRIGLSLSKNNASIGTISVNSARDEGSEFTLKFPIPANVALSMM